MTPIFYGTVSKEGKLTLHQPERMKDWLRKIANKEVCVYVEISKDSRSLAQNAYYWAVIVEMVSKEMGVIPDDAHEFLKSLFLKKGIDYKGERYEITRSTTSLKTDEFVEYTEKCRQWAGVELEIVVPLPGEIVVE